MPFGNITSGTDTYAPRGDGNYTLSTLTFAAPTEELNIRGYSKNKNKTISGSTQYVLEKDITVSGVTTRRAFRLTLTGELDANFTAAEFINGVKAIYDFHNTSGFTDRQLQGEA